MFFLAIHSPDSRPTKTLDLIPLYAKISPTDSSLIPTNIQSDVETNATSLSSSNDADFDFAASLVLLSETKQLDITSRFRRDADAYYVEAKRSTVSSVAQIPYWMYGVLVVLGWNEAMVVLFNPLYFALLLGLLGFAYVFSIALPHITLIILYFRWIIIQLNMVGPLFLVVRRVTEEVCC